MARYGNKVDGIHSAVRDKLRADGWEVLDTHDMPGFVDLIARLPGMQGLPCIPYFIEVKDGRKPPSQRRLTDQQKKLLQFIPFYVIKEVGGRLIPGEEYLKETEND